MLIILMSILSYSEMSIAAQKSTGQSNTPHVELTFSGIGATETKAFTVHDGWKVEWETESPNFQLSAHGTAKRPYIAPTNEREEVLRWFETVRPIVLANTTKPNGTAFHPLGGTFFLKIVTEGRWSIHLQTIPDTKDYLDVPYTGAP